MNRLKLSGSKWAGYTGVIGTIDFKDGISVYPVPRPIADRLSAAIQMVEIDEDGNEIGVAGVATRLIAEASNRAPILKPLHRQTEAERKVEDASDRSKGRSAAPTPFHTIAELEKIADEKGIKGLRKVADAWSIKGRKIPELIQSILSAQSKFIAERDKGLERSAAQVVEPVVTDEPSKPEAPDPDQLSLPDIIVEGAAAGDMAAAITVASSMEG